MKLSDVDLVSTQSFLTLTKLIIYLTSEHTTPNPAKADSFLQSRIGQKVERNYVSSYNSCVKTRRSFIREIFCASTLCKKITQAFSTALHLETCLGLQISIRRPNFNSPQSCALCSDSMCKLTPNSQSKEATKLDSTC